jgi:hypothetical protein
MPGGFPADARTVRLDPQLVVVAAVPSGCVPGERFSVIVPAPLERLGKHHQVRRVVVHPHEFHHAFVRQTLETELRRIGRHVRALALRLFVAWGLPSGSMCIVIRVSVRRLLRMKMLAPVLPKSDARQHQRRNHKKRLRRHS